MIVVYKWMKYLPIPVNITATCHCTCRPAFKSDNILTLLHPHGPPIKTPPRATNFYRLFVDWRVSILKQATFFNSFAIKNEFETERNVPLTGASWILLGIEIASDRYLKTRIFLFNDTWHSAMKWWHYHNHCDTKFLRTLASSRANITILICCR